MVVVKGVVGQRFLDMLVVLAVVVVLAPVLVAQAALVINRHLVVEMDMVVMVVMVEFTAPQVQEEAVVPVAMVVLVELEVFQDLRQVMVVKGLEHLQFLGYLQQLLVYHLMANLQVVVVVLIMVLDLPPLMMLV
tara:strand:- start:198 stop:599 length:402 start_codon:yes stop_codon:yes gene_type:complete